MPISLLPLFFSISLLLIFSTNLSHAYKQCKSDQKTLLLNLKNELKFHPSSSSFYRQKLVWWNQTDNCCSWEGVECDGVGHVISLQLDREGIYGGLESSSSLFSLRYLTKLNLAQNIFNGNSIPRGIGNLTYLIHLDLSNAGFGGQIPIELSLLTNLVSLYLSDLHLKLEYPNLAMVLHNLTRLTDLYLDGNNLLTIVPNFFVNFSSLTFLNLRNCSLKGSLDLSNNLFDSNSSMFSHPLSNLYDLDLSDNSLNGSIPQSLFGLPSLQRLDLSDNQFSGKLHEFPTLKFSNMKMLDLSSNRLEGPIPESFFQLERIQVLHLSDNLFNDTCQLEKILRLPNLKVLDLSNNKFVDSIPPNIRNFTSSLGSFSLRNNSISGSIPHSLCNHVNLQVLDLSLNNITGTIPPCLLENLEVLNLGRNNIYGHIPDKFTIDCQLSTLDLDDNSLTGRIPLSLARCKSLVEMTVRNNKMSDTFPCMLSSSLRILVLRSNRFHGELRCNNTWPSLQIIDIASNNFSGNLHPLNFSSWRGMMAISDRQLTRNSSFFDGQNEVTLIIKGRERKLVKIPPYFILIDFSCNNFKGEIPEVIGDLTSLYHLNLSHNALIGTIPRSLGKLGKLEALDLSKNELKGVIPMELAGLTFLQVLNLSYNKLVGEIPFGYQLQTFSSDSFEGNMGLCGWPTNISCGNTKEGSVELEEKKIEIEWEYVSIVFGYIVGLGSFVWVLFGCMRFRDIYFHKIDDILENISISHNKKLEEDMEQELEEMR